MDALEAIRSRRMLPRVGAEPPGREVVAELLELAVRAPNHHATEPWRFYVLAGDERDRLARAIADEEVASRPTTPPTTPQEALRTARAKVGRAPVIVVFTCLASDDPKVVEQEELVSVAMAMQNVLLAAYAKGLGAMLRTGAAAYHPAVREHLGLAEGEKVVGFVYLGLPEADREPTHRSPAAAKTVWLG